MLAERLPGLLPDLSPTTRRWRSPRSTRCSAGCQPVGRWSPGRRSAPRTTPRPSPSLVGGGSGIAGARAISLAHRGRAVRRRGDRVRPAGARGAAPAARVGLGDDHPRRRRATYPSRFQLVLAANPCPCSRGGRATDAARCRCTSVQLRAYRSRLSGPLLDRIDLRARLAADEPRDPRRRRARRADGRRPGPGRGCPRARRAGGCAGTPWTHQRARCPGPSCGSRWRSTARGAGRLSSTSTAARSSTRGVDRVLKVAWTLADLAGRDLPNRDDVETRPGAAASTRRRADAGPVLARTA